MLQLRNERLDRFHTACRVVLRHCPDEYAKAYADLGLISQTTEDISAYCLCILRNSKCWYGLEARLTKQALKEIING